MSFPAVKVNYPEKQVEKYCATDKKQKQQLTHSTTKGIKQIHCWLVLGFVFNPALENESKEGRRRTAFCNGERQTENGEVRLSWMPTSDHFTSAIYLLMWKMSQHTEVISEPVSNSKIFFLYEAIRNKFGKYRKKRLSVPLSLILKKIIKQSVSALTIQGFQSTTLVSTPFNNHIAYII